MASIYSDESVRLDQDVSDDVNPVVNAIEKSLQHLLTQSLPITQQRHRQQGQWERFQAPRHLSRLARRTQSHTS